jgi:DsbC/DsbD-like thiol-disulfide interchange protein
MVPFVLAAAVLSFGQGDTAPKVSITVSKSTVTAGKPIQAILSVTFAEGLHGYQNPPSDPTLIPVVVKSADSVFKVVKVSYPKGTPAKVGGESSPVNVYAGTIKIPVTLTAPTKLGKATLTLKFDYQQCNEQACFPPNSISAKVNLTVVKAGAAKAGTAIPKVGR